MFLFCLDFWFFGGVVTDGFVFIVMDLLSCWLVCSSC